MHVICHALPFLTLPGAFLHYRVWYLHICISSWVISWEANYRSHVWQQPRCIVEIWLLNASVTTATNCEGNIGGSNVMKVSGAVRMEGECRAGGIYSFIIMTQWWDLARNCRTADLLGFYFFFFLFQSRFWRLLNWAWLFGSYVYFWEKCPRLLRIRSWVRGTISSLKSVAYCETRRVINHGFLFQSWEMISTVFVAGEMRLVLWRISFYAPWHLRRHTVWSSLLETAWARTVL